MKCDLLFVNGSVLTMDARNTVTEAVAVKGGRIVATGKTADLEGLKGPFTRVVELEGRSLLPGFIEAHNHMLSYGCNKAAIDCKGQGIGSVEDIKRSVREATKRKPPGSWIRGWGYNHNKLAEKRHPNRWDLDEVAPDNPVKLTRTCGHIAVVNSKALEMAGLSDDTPDPSGGKFGRENGRLTGILYESAAEPVDAVSSLSYREISDGVREALRDYMMYGITSSHDAGSDEGFVNVLQDLAASGDLKVRMYFMVLVGAIGSRQGMDFVTTGLRTGFGNDRLKVGSFKVMVDGSSSGPTAATREPYDSDRDNRGILCFTQEELDDMFEAAHATGYQITAHAVGDRAIEMVLDSMEKALKKHPRADHRHRIEHCAICPPDLMERLARMQVIPVHQPPFFHEFGDGYLANYGEHRVEHMFPAKSLLKMGVHVVGSSDSPVTYLNPFLGISTALTRLSQTGQVCGAGERVDIMEALRMYTYNGAYASFEESVKGSLEPGKFADMAVLSRDITAVPAEDILDMKVDMTVIDGEIVFEG